MGNYNRKSRRIIELWYKKAQKPVKEPKYDYFDRFISLWVSFNAFFVAEFHNEASILANGKEPWEKKYLEAIYSDNHYIELYSDLINNSKSFKDNLDFFIELVDTITICKGKIIDMRPERRDCENGQEFSDKYNFEQFILTAYQIRCNLFHGNKSPESDNDFRIVKTMFILFKELLSNIYQIEGYNVGGK